MNELLRSTDVIDWCHPAVMAQAHVLRGDLADPIAIARRAFEWVRDEIKHSADFGLRQVTVAASEVLKERTGTATPRVICSQRCCGRMVFPQGSVINGS